MGEVIAFDHIHLISRDPKAAVEPWELKPGMVLCYVAEPEGVTSR